MFFFFFVFSLGGRTYYSLLRVPKYRPRNVCCDFRVFSFGIINILFCFFMLPPQV